MEQPTKRSEPPETRVAGPRLGPRPLPLHLGLAVLAWQSSKVALPLLRTGSLPWKAHLAEAAVALQQNLAKTASEAFEDAVARENRVHGIGRITGRHDSQAELPATRTVPEVVPKPF